MYCCYNYVLFFSSFSFSFSFSFSSLLSRMLAREAGSYLVCWVAPAKTRAESSCHLQFLLFFIIISLFGSAGGEGCWSPLALFFGALLATTIKWDSCVGSKRLGKGGLSVFGLRSSVFGLLLLSAFKDLAHTRVNSFGRGLPLLLHLKILLLSVVGFLLSFFFPLQQCI